MLPTYESKLIRILAVCEQAESCAQEMAQLFVENSDVEAIRQLSDLLGVIHAMTNKGLSEIRQVDHSQVE